MGREPLDLTIEEARLVRPARRAGATRWLNRSAGLSDDDAAALERQAEAFGDRPAGVTCELAVSVRPLGRDRVVIAEARDQSNGLPEPDGWPLEFRFRVLSRRLYEALGDPFGVLDELGDRPAPQWPGEPLPPRTIAELQTVLKEGDTPLLLGGVQSVLDGGRVVLVRTSPVDGFARGLWRLLPDASRGRRWLSTFAFAHDPDLHLQVLPPGVPFPDGPGVLVEERVHSYPDSNYERSLQAAVEAGDQGALDRELRRGDAADMARLMLWLLGAMIVVATVLPLLMRARG